MLNGCPTCNGSGNVCPDCRNARYVKHTDRSFGVDKQDYGPCPSCTHKIEGKLIQSKPAKEARIRQYVADREWEREEEPMHIIDIVQQDNEMADAIRAEMKDDDIWKDV